MKGKDASSAGTVLTCRPVCWQRGSHLWCCLLRCLSGRLHTAQHRREQQLCVSQLMGLNMSACS
jgi:hypothetical protein